MLIAEQQLVVRRENRRMKNEERIMAENKITSFTQLNAWRRAHDLALYVYKLTKDFPKEELFCLTSQVRRAAISVTSNIAEGFSRLSNKEKIQFYSMSLGSLTEAHNQLIFAKDLKYITAEELKIVTNSVITTHKLINGLIKSTRSRIHTS